MSVIKTGLGTKFVKEAIENDDYEYCNRSKAEACARIANEHARAFAQWIHNNPSVLTANKSISELLIYFNENY